MGKKGWRIGCDRRGRGGDCLALRNGNLDASVSHRISYCMHGYSSVSGYYCVALWPLY